MSRRVLTLGLYCLLAGCSHEPAAPTAATEADCKSIVKIAEKNTECEECKKKKQCKCHHKGECKHDKD